MVEAECWDLVNLFNTCGIFLPLPVYNQSLILTHSAERYDLDSFSVARFMRMLMLLSLLLLSSVFFFFGFGSIFFTDDTFWYCYHWRGLKMKTNASIPFITSELTGVNYIRRTVGIAFGSILLSTHNNSSNYTDVDGTCLKLRYCSSCRHPVFSIDIFFLWFDYLTFCFLFFHILLSVGCDLKESHTSKDYAEYFLIVIFYLTVHMKVWNIWEMFVYICCLHSKWWIIIYDVDISVGIEITNISLENKWVGIWDYICVYVAAIVWQNIHILFILMQACRNVYGSVYQSVCYTHSPSVCMYVCISVCL